jgi:hypothetical protein
MHNKKLLENCYIQCYEHWYTRTIQHTGEISINSVLTAPAGEF